MKLIDLTGRVYSKLTVLSYLGNSKWECRCECGNITKVRTGDLSGGNSTRCRTCSNRLPNGETGFNNLYSKYKLRALKFNRVFELTKEEFKIITSSDCHYCGLVPTFRSTSTKNNVTNDTLINSIYLYNGIDRKDSAQGYTIDNSLPCCEFCNKAKRDMSYEEFLNHLKRISKYYDTNKSRSDC